MRMTRLHGTPSRNTGFSRVSMNNIILLGLVSFINDASSKMIMPVLPLFIASIGGSGLAVGIIAGISDSLAALLKMFSGYWSDKYGKKKPFVLSGYGLSSVSKLMLAFSFSWWHVLLLRSSERIGKGIRSAPRDAILAGSTEEKNRGKSFGLHRAFDSGGSVLGSVMALMLLVVFSFSFEAIFLAAGVLSFFSLIPLLPVREVAGKAKKMSILVSLSSLSPRLRLFIITASVFSLANFSYMFFILRAQEFFSAGLSVSMPIALYTLYLVLYTVFAVPAGSLSDRIGREKVLMLGYALFALTALGFTMVSGIYFIVILFILYGIVYALVNATERAFVSDLAEKSSRGTALGTFHMATAISALPGAIIAGLLWDAIGSSATFLYGASLAVVACLMLSLVLLRK